MDNCQRCGYPILGTPTRITSAAGPEYLDQTVCYACAAEACRLDPEGKTLVITPLVSPASMP